MAKILIGPQGDGGTYSFNKTAKTVTITLPSGRMPTLENLLLITDTTNNIMIYNFADPSKGATLTNNVFTLDHNTNTGSYANTDKLQIWYYDSIPQTVNVDDMHVAFKMAMQNSTKNLTTGNYAGKTRVAVEEGMLNTVSTVGSINAIVNTTLRPDELQNPQMTSNWYDKVRKQIT